MSARHPRSVVTFPIVLRELTVLRVADVTPGMRRVTLGGAQLTAFRKDGFDLPELRTEGFDDHVKFFFAEGDNPPVLPSQNVSSLDWPADRRPLTKDYTPVRFDPAAGEIDFDFVRHDGGTAATWAERAEPGSTTWIAGPKMSHSHPVGADWLLAIGDETALPAIGRWLAEMPAGTRARVFVEVGEDSHRQDLPTAADAEITWLVRGGAPAGTTDLLEQAVRGMEWLPGKVFVWAAGEAVTLKGIRRHLAAERQVPREQTHITGYWRRTEPAVTGPGTAATAATADTADEDDAHERLHELTDLAPGFAIRTAVTLGLVELIHQGVGDLGALARRTGSHEPTLAVLLAYLVDIGLFSAPEGDAPEGGAPEGGAPEGGATKGDGYRLTPVGEELVEDDHSSDEYHLGNAQAALDLSLAGLLHSVRTGEAGRPLGDALATDERLGSSARATVEDEARWIVPGILGGHDWSAVGALDAGGDGAGAVANALLKEFPALRVRIAGLPSALRVVREQILAPEVLDRAELLPRSCPLPPAGGAHTALLVRLLERLPDEDAVLALREAAGALPHDGTLLLAEQVRPPGGGDGDTTLHHLRLKCAFGSGVRTVEEFTALTARAGLVAHTCRDIGWDHRMWTLSRPVEQ